MHSHESREPFGPLARRTLVLLACACFLPIPSSLSAQSPGETTRGAPARWSVSLDLGSTIPGSIYDQLVDRFSSDSLRTRWREEAGWGPRTRFAVRLNPEAGLNFILGGVHGWTPTDAHFSGGAAPPETIRRTYAFTGLEFGVGVRLAEWAEGRGIMEYVLAPTIMRQTIDLGAGHRDAFAFRGDTAPAGALGWTNRTFTSWGFNLAASLRLPVRDDISLRATFQDMIMPINTVTITDQEVADIRAMTGETVKIVMGQFTSHQMSFSVGLEYTLSFGKLPEVDRRQAVVPDDIPAVAAEVVRAMRLMAEGDTLAALAMLTEAVLVAPQDSYAWRELSLIRANRAEIDPSLRNEALATLERALNLNPGDTELLRAYGRVRALVEREGRLPAAPILPVQLSELSLEVLPGGRVRLGWSMYQLARSEEGQYRHRSDIEVFDAEGGRVPIRSERSQVRQESETLLMVAGATSALPAGGGVEFFLVDPKPGIYTVRVRVTDPETDLRNEVIRAFQLSGA